MKLSRGRIRGESDAYDPPPLTIILRILRRFVEDWEYVPGIGTLDECNGMEDTNGNYGYYCSTETYPFAPRCVFGTPDPSFTKESCTYDPDNMNDCNEMSFIRSINYHNAVHDHDHEHESTTNSGTVQALASVGVAAVAAAGGNMINVI